MDRNYICGALAKYLNENHGSGKDTASTFQSMYETTALYVDAATKQVLVRPKDSTQQTPLSYDILLGCDGIRSVVRNAFITNHRGMFCIVVSLYVVVISFHLEIR